MGSLYRFDPDDAIVPNRGIAFRAAFSTANDDGATQKYNAPGAEIAAAQGARNTKWNGSAVVALSRGELDAIQADLDATEAARIKAEAKSWVSKFAENGLSTQGILEVLRDEVNTIRRHNLLLMGTRDSSEIAEAYQVKVDGKTRT